MTLLKRLRNLWKLSEWEPTELHQERELPQGTVIAPLHKVPNKKAEIIKRGEPVGEFLDKVNQNNP